MLTELQIQAKLVEAIKEVGGFGYKQSNKFLAGPPDLFLTHEDTGPVFIEVKLMENPSRPVLVTPLQELTMKRMQKAKTKCGVAVVIPAIEATGGGYFIYITSDPTKKRIDSSWKMFDKKRGEQWPIIEMMEVCDTMPHGLDISAMLYSETDREDMDT